MSLLAGVFPELLGRKRAKPGNRGQLIEVVGRYAVTAETVAEARLPNEPRVL